MAHSTCFFINFVLPTKGYTRNVSFIVLCSGQIPLESFFYNVLDYHAKCNQNRTRIKEKDLTGRLVEESAFCIINSSFAEQNGRHFADDNFECIFEKEKLWISIQMSMNFVPKSSIDNKSLLFKVMVWCQTGGKPLPEPMLAQFTDVYMWHKGKMS